MKSYIRIEAWVGLRPDPGLLVSLVTCLSVIFDQRSSWLRLHLCISIYIDRSSMGSSDGASVSEVGDRKVRPNSYTSQACQRCRSRKQVRPSRRRVLRDPEIDSSSAMPVEL